MPWVVSERKSRRKLTLLRPQVVPSSGDTPGVLNPRPLEHRIFWHTSYRSRNAGELGSHTRFRIFELDRIEEVYEKYRSVGWYRQRGSKQDKKFGSEDH
ncbi:hypothetical protein E2C01_019543 [Portunus trituberculatus]|uniref:Uncharacterized protein n=1 Tax=Portunus trituberculatus TaxID=210409 RepID=A0A5B7DZN6_PORTR|nr:hypothetical protein [Portunus trituberculatus]